MKKYRFLPEYLLTLIFISLLSACSGGGDLLHLVPADNVQTIATLRVNRLLEEAGCTRNSDGTWQPTPALLRLTERNVTPKIISSLIPLSASLDLEESVFWVTTDNSSWFLCRISDSSGLERRLSECGFTATADGDFKLFSSPGQEMRWFVKDQYLWVSNESSSTVTALTSQIDKADKASAGSIAGVGDFLKAGGLARIAVANTLLGSGWIRGAISTEEQSLTAALSYVDDSGKVTEVKGLRNIDRSFLDFVPHDIPFLGALGVDDDFNWNAVAKAAGLIFGFQAYGTVEAMMPILKSVKGTVAVAFMPGSDDPFDTSSETMRFALFAEMKAGDARSALTKLRAYASRLGIPVTSGPNDSFAVSFGDSVYYAVYSSGYFIISNFRPERLTRHATMAAGGLASVSLTLSPTTLDAVIGLGEVSSPLSVTGTLTGEEAGLQMRFTDSTAPFIQALTTVLAE